MSPVKIHEKDGVLGIYDADYPETMTDPNGNVEHAYFHSGLDYYERFYRYEGTLNLPQRPTGIYSGNYGKTSYTLPNHNFGGIPHGVIVRDDYALSPGQPIQQAGVNYRYLTLKLTENGAQVEEFYHLPNQSLAAMSLNIQVHLVQQITGGDSGYLVREVPAMGYFEFDRGRITPDKHFLKADNASPEFYIRHGKTLDLKNGGIRHVTPGGGVIDADGYNGTFALTGDYGVRVDG